MWNTPHNYTSDKDVVRMANDQKTVEQQLAELEQEYKPRIIEALQAIGLQIADDISDEELEQVTNNEEVFRSKLPEGMTIEDAKNHPATAALQELLMEVIEKAQAILLGGLLGG